MCYWTHGRLSVYEGGAPSYRLWKIGTRRILGIFNGPSHFPPAIEEYDENPELPATLLRAYEADNQRMKKKSGITWTIPPPVFADFEICPLAPERKGEMQSICIESAKNIFVEPEYQLRAPGRSVRDRVSPTKLRPTSCTFKPGTTCACSTDSSQAC